MFYWWCMNEIWIWRIGGMILTGENRSTWRQTCRSAIMSTTIPTWTGRIYNVGLCSDTPKTTHCIIVLLRCNFRILHYAQFAFSRRREIYKNSWKEYRMRTEILLAIWTQVWYLAISGNNIWNPMYTSHSLSYMFSTLCKLSVGRTSSYSMLSISSQAWRQTAVWTANWSPI